MAKCAHCDAIILFGGTQVGDRLYCGQACRDKDFLQVALEEIPAGFVEERAWLIHQGACPECGERGPIEAHTSHTVWTIGPISRHKTNPFFGCQSCGTRARLMAILSCGLFGWWGPRGLVLTPIQILRNLSGLVTMPDTSQPSLTLIERVRSEIAAKLIEEDQQLGKSEVGQPNGERTER